MAWACGISKNKKVLDVGSGKGATACHLAQKYSCEVVGVDLSERMVGYANRNAKNIGIDDRVIFKIADATNLPFDNDSFDIVLAECTTVLLDKESAFSEFLRVVKTDGFVGDLEMTWRKTPPRELEDLVYDVWGGFKTTTLDEWKKFFEKLGMRDVVIADFSDRLADLEKETMRMLGFFGIAKMAFRLTFRPDLRKAMFEYRRIFKEYKEYIGYGYVVGKR